MHTSDLDFCDPNAPADAGDTADWSLTDAEIAAGEAAYCERHGLRVAELRELDHLDDEAFNRRMEEVRSRH